MGEQGGTLIHRVTDYKNEPLELLWPDWAREKNIREEPWSFRRLAGSEDGVVTPAGTSLLWVQVMIERPGLILEVEGTSESESSAYLHTYDLGTHDLDDASLVYRPEDLISDFIEWRNAGGTDQLVAEFSKTVERLIAAMNVVAADNALLVEQLRLNEIEIQALRDRVAHLSGVLTVLNAAPKTEEPESTKKLLEYIRSTFTELPKKATQGVILAVDGVEVVQTVVSLATEAIGQIPGL